MTKRGYFNFVLPSFLHLISKKGSTLIYWFTRACIILSWESRFRVYFRLIFFQQIQSHKCDTSEIKTVHTKQVKMWNKPIFMSDSRSLDPEGPFNFINRSWNPVCPHGNCRLKKFNTVPKIGFLQIYHFPVHIWVWN